MKDVQYGWLTLAVKTVIFILSIEIRGKITLVDDEWIQTGRNCMLQLESTTSSADAAYIQII